MTGFRVAFGGAQELYNIKPDLTTLGKIIGGGLPVGAYGGAAEIMNLVAPLGPMYQAGTLSGNPLAMAAGLAMLCTLRKQRASSFIRAWKSSPRTLVNRVCAGGARSRCRDDGQPRGIHVHVLLHRSRRSPIGTAPPAATPSSSAASIGPC